ncbi:MAG TPA: hypothetical protein VIA62_09625 [Thermoanaerobaculia bacterium]|nr:hypothetical protein [Thermoanaerobaculia bacterium]
MSEPSVPPPPSYTPPPPPIGAPPPGGVSPNRTLMLVLSYLGLLALIPLLVEKNDPEVQWHAKHGLVLFVAEFILFILINVLHFIPVLGTIIGCMLTVVLPLGILVLHIVCILKAVKGERFIIPGISEFADRF